MRRPNVVITSNGIIVDINDATVTQNDSVNHVSSSAETCRQDPNVKHVFAICGVYAVF